MGLEKIVDGALRSVKKKWYEGLGIASGIGLVTGGYITIGSAAAGYLKYTVDTMNPISRFIGKLCNYWLTPAEKLGMKGVYSYQRLERRCNPTLDLIYKLVLLFPALSLDKVLR